MLEAHATDHVRVGGTRASCACVAGSCCADREADGLPFLTSFPPPSFHSDVFDNGQREPPKVEREDERKGARSGAVLRTTAEAYMLFKNGIRPVTEFELTPGKRVTLGRRRAELAVRELACWLGREIEPSMRGLEAAAALALAPDAPL